MSKYNAPEIRLLDGALVKIPRQVVVNVARLAAAFVADVAAAVACARASPSAASYSVAAEILS